MDLFIDKLAQKFTPDDDAKKNQAADAKEIKKLREKVENYEKLLQEMKLVNLKNMESAEKLRDMVEDIAAAMDKTESEEHVPDMTALTEVKEAADADREMIRGLFDRQSDTIHKENIKVYRNVQAAVTDSLTDQTKSILDAQQAGFKKSGTGFLKVMSILIFIAILADIALKVLPMLGIIL